MGFTEAEISSLEKLFKDKGFLGYSKGRYQFTLNRSCKAFKAFLKELGVPNALVNYPALENIRLKYNSSIIDLPSWEAFIKEYSEANRSERVEIAQVEIIEEEGEEEATEAKGFVQSLVPAINISKGAKDRIILLDPSRDNRPVSEVDPEIYLTLTETSLAGLIANDSVLKVLTTFDPYNLKSLFVKESKHGSITTWHVNYYIAPRWRHTEAIGKYEGFFKKLVEHLFPVEEEREYVLDWMHYAIVHRNDTILSLIGPRGTGKGVLIKDVLGRLMGQDYFEIVNQEILTDKFNGSFDNRRMLFFDEVNVSGDRELNRLKAYANDMIALEKKGEDATTIDNFTSMALSSNDKKDFKAEPQERRFSVPEVTEVPLLSIFTEEEVDAFCKDMANPNSIQLAEIGNYLINRKPKYSPRKPLKGKYYFELCKLSMPEWKLFIIETIIHEGVEGEGIKPSALAKKFRKIHGEKSPFATRKGTIETFLGDYKHEGLYRIGTVEDLRDEQRGRDTYQIIPDPEFLKRFGLNTEGSSEDREEDFDDALDAL